MVDTVNEGPVARLEHSCGPGPSDWIKVAPSKPGLERIEARFAGHAFDPHRHDTYALGITIRGVQSFDYRGSERHSTPGRVIVLHPDEVHNGHAGCADGFLYRMLYVEPCLVRAALGERPIPLPFLSEPLSTARPLVKAVRAALGDVDTPLEDLEADQVIADLADALMAGDASAPVRRRPAIDTAAASRVRAFIDGCAQDPVTSKDLEAVGGLDRYALARQFRFSFGTSPHRYLVMRRLDRARALMHRGAGLSEAAAATGFADQSHMTRHFKKTYGMAPGRWARLSGSAPTRDRSGRFECGC